MDSKRFDSIYPDQWIVSGINVYNEIYVATHDKENFNAITIPLSNAEVKELVQHLTNFWRKTMDRYLFRGLRADNEGWVYGNLNTFNDKEWVFIKEQVDLYGTMSKVIPETVGQKHNKLSKCEVNGKEVFVGDELIINWYNGRNAPRKGSHKLTTVEYWDDNIVSCEVIGNIHQEANNA